MRKSMLPSALLLLLMLPTVAYAHGAEILAFPASWAMTLLVGLGLIVFRYRANWYWLLAGLILATVISTVVAAYLPDRLSPWYVPFWVFATGLSIPPLVVCCLVGEWRRRRMTKSPR